MSYRTRSRKARRLPFKTLKKLRNERDLSMADMAKVVGITEGSYLAKENGIRDFKFTELDILSKYFGESADAIFFS